MKRIASEFRIWFCNFIIAYIPFHFIRLAYYRYVMLFKIGKGSSIHLGCRFNSSGYFSMADNSTINQFCHIDNRGGIEIGQNVSISPRVGLITADHDINTEHAEGRTNKIVIGDYVFIGFNAIVLKGCTMHTGSVLGAMSVLTADADAYGIYFGVPAVFKKERNRNLSYEFSYKRLFH